MQYVKRTWGWYLVLLNGKRFKIKLLRFKAGSQLSYQYHQFRSELWLFIKGGGWFTHEGMTYHVGKGDYVITQINEKHTYKATSTTYAIEVQYGTKCVELDIVRL